MQWNALKAQEKTALLTGGKIGRRKATGKRLRVDYSTFYPGSIMILYSNYKLGGISARIKAGIELCSPDSTAQAPVFCSVIISADISASILRGKTRQIQLK
jgi:hypothetical protein